ncbi:MAG: TonB-dependent receptor, partial [Acidobacteria bacterium]|nr:TonB-dependent receptor [Acidobacteriota bacterium]
SWASHSLLCLAFIAMAIPALALDGRVIDERTGKPIANAEVTILGRPGVAYTNADGRFTWKPDPSPPFEILVILPGERFTKPVLVEALPADGVLEIRIAPLVSETVTVTAGAAPDIEATPGSATTLLPSQEILGRQPANLAQALESVAGVSTVSEGHAAVPAIRGLARGRTLILIDGARVTSDRRVGPSATYLDPFVLDGIEVARGPGSVAYGSDAFGGVIYARTRRIAPNAPFGGRVTGALGAGIPQQRVGLELSKGFVKGGAVFQAHYRDFDNYDSPGGEVVNSGATDQGFLARGEHEIGRGVFNAVWQSDFGRDIDRPRNNSQTVRFYYPIEDSHRFTASYDLRQVAGFERLAVHTFLGRYRQMTDQDRFATATRGRSLERADYAANDFQVRGSAERLSSRARIEVGVDLNGRFNVNALDFVTQYSVAGDVTSRVESVSIDQATRRDTGAYAALEAAFAPKVTVGAGVRGDYVTSNNRGGYFGDRSTSHGAASGSASITVGPWAGMRLTGQVGSGFRDPTVSDRYYRGPTGRGFITGNPDLDPERSIQFDVGLRYTSSRVRAGLFGYQYRINDLIERYQTATDFFFFRNRGRARIRGIELEVQAVLGAQFTLESTAAVTRGQALDDGTGLDDIPPATFTLAMRRPIASRGFAQVRGAFYGADDRPGPTEIRMPGYSLVDVIGGVALTKWIDVNVTLRNLLDQTFPVSPDARAVSAPGASAVVTVTARF